MSNVIYEPTTDVDAGPAGPIVAEEVLALYLCHPVQSELVPRVGRGSFPRWSTSHEDWGGRSVDLTRPKLRTILKSSQLHLCSEISRILPLF
jgi:hypothetical protein